MKRVLTRLLVAGGAFLVSAVAVEGVFRVVERNARPTESGGGCWVAADARWGWRPAAGTCTIQTPEFSVRTSTNSLSMNDEPFRPEDDVDKIRILALGDSHTQAVGVEPLEAWPKMLQRDLEATTGRRVRVYNAGTAGYSLHQYLLRLLDQGPILKPHYVVVGLSLATDLFDLMPPDHGGWAYFEPWQRDYFDFDASGGLALRHSTPAAESVSRSTASATPLISAFRVRRLIQHFATFRYLRHTNLALVVGSHVRIGGASLWPNMDVVVERDVAPDHQYNWRLAFALLDRINAETTKLHARLVVLIVPYLPQVYDDVWRNTFGNDQRYSRTASVERLETWLQSKGIVYVDSTESLRSAAVARGHWL